MEKLSKKWERKKCLVVYYSRAGKNYFNGDIVDLKIGNTEIVAKKIHEYVDGDLFKLETEQSYPDGYYEATEIAQKELNEQARPALKKLPAGVENYDVIFLGYPCWWGTMPMCVFTFLEAFDFSKKIIIPFCTHEGSGFGNSREDLKKLCPKSEVLDGFKTYGYNAENCDKELKEYLEG